MAKSYRVAVLGTQQKDQVWMAEYGLQVFDLNVDQICTLLENHDIEKGIDYSVLGAQPGMTYQVMGGGRFWPMVSREEITRVMEGVDVLIAMLAGVPSFYYNSGIFSEFFMALAEDNCMDKCSAIIVRIVHPNPSGRGRQQRRNAPTNDSIMKMYGMKPDAHKEKTYVIADEFGKKKKKGKGKKGGQEDTVERQIAQLKAKLVGEEWMEVVTQPVKETLSAGKALVGLGHRFSSWVGRLVGASTT